MTGLLFSLMRAGLESGTFIIILEHQLSGISHFRDMPFLIAWLMTREYTKPMLFCDKVFIFSKNASSLV
jgi:hypothetical protein